MSPRHSLGPCLHSTPSCSVVLKAVSKQFTLPQDIEQVSPSNVRECKVNFVVNALHGRKHKVVKAVP